ncbi:Uncharacterised protein [Vibrio cholerae]|nr:Uncharacterised protein [Vibrio cholerae]
MCDIAKKVKSHRPHLWLFCRNYQHWRISESRPTVYRRAF